MRPNFRLFPISLKRIPPPRKKNHYYKIVESRYWYPFCKIKFENHSLLNYQVKYECVKEPSGKKGTSDHNYEVS